MNRPLALVNSVWSAGAEDISALMEGMRFACDRFGVPMVGGHSNQQSTYQALSVSVLGVAEGPVLSAREARPGDELWMLVNKAGSFYLPLLGCRDPCPARASSCATCLAAHAGR